MTTHEQHTLTDSPEEAAVPVSEAPRIEDESTAVAPEPVPAADPVEPAAHPVEPAVDSAEPSIDTTAPPSAEVPEAEPPSAKHESSADELLFAGDDLADLRARWAGVQAAFVDDPKECVQKADGLVSDLVEHLTTGF
ncbi:MAG: hypothetical protein QOH34_4074, partial [Mycobacterium sp.]|nr:hypothetical protein [Mycobacterium sp.]